MSNSFNTLIEQVRSCTLCAPHLPLTPKPIIQLNSAAKILIAGQAPGQKAHDSGIAFDDPSGKRLRNWMGVNCEQFYDEKIIAILPMGFCYPGTGKSGDSPPRVECAEYWSEKLLAELPNIKLTLLIGQYAQNWHLKNRKKTNLTETVKAWQEYWTEILPLPHPSPRNNRWFKQNPWFESEVIPLLQNKISKLLA